MKILINTTNGQVLLFRKVMRSEEKLAYTLYDNGITYQYGKALEDGLLPLDNSVVLPEGLTISQALEYVGLETLKAKFAGFVETTDPSNWVFPTGSTGLETMIRVLIPSDLIGKELYTGSHLDLLVQAMSPLTEWSTRGAKYIVQYLEELLPEHEAILLSYAAAGVIIDKKPVPVVEPVLYNVTFNVTENNEPVDGAEISINGNNSLTDNLGVAVTQLEAGTHDYTVTYPASLGATGQVVVVDSDMIVNVSI